MSPSAALVIRPRRTSGLPFCQCSPVTAFGASAPPRPATIVMGNSRPLAAWIVMMRSESSPSSVLSSTRSTSSMRRSTHARYSASVPPVASLHARASSMTYRTLSPRLAGHLLAFAQRRGDAAPAVVQLGEQLGGRALVLAPAELIERAQRVADDARLLACTPGSRVGTGAARRRCRAGSASVGGRRSRRSTCAAR